LFCAQKQLLFAHNVLFIRSSRSSTFLADSLHPTTCTRAASRRDTATLAFDEHSQRGERGDDSSVIGHVRRANTTAAAAAAAATTTARFDQRVSQQSHASFKIDDVEPQLRGNLLLVRHLFSVYIFGK
jgi:hypothetical protein